MNNLEAINKKLDAVLRNVSLNDNIIQADANAIKSLIEIISMQSESLEYYKRFAALPKKVQLSERIGGGKAHETLTRTLEILGGGLK